ncbi:hypothetical protein CG001_02955 [Mesoplasma coleopterae]|nr:hypothetical protein CG001_02955 [Mesoplasma coleopterae]
MKYSAIEIIQIISALFIVVIGVYISIFNIIKIKTNKSKKIIINFWSAIILLVISIILFI